MRHRILIKGGSGAGKSTLARELARALELPRVELDALHHGPNWAPASAAELRAKVLSTLDDSRGWVVDGNYDSKLGNMLVDRADIIVWLHLALGLKLWRLHRRPFGWIVNFSDPLRSRPEKFTGLCPDLSAGCLPVPSTQASLGVL